MANDCLPQIQACALRVARLEPNGVPDPGANNLYVSDALVMLTFTPEMEEGDEIVKKNACGSLCVNYQDRPRIKRFNVELEICVPDPQLMELLAGGTVLTSGAKVGYAYPALGIDATPNGVSIELWAKRINSAGAQDPTYPWAWWVLPRVYLTHDAKNFENAAQETKFQGFAIENDSWFNGPLNDWPLTADSDRAVQWLPSATIPNAQCGYQTTAAS